MPMLPIFDVPEPEPTPPARADEPVDDHVEVAVEAKPKLRRARRRPGARRASPVPEKRTERLTTIRVSHAEYDAIETAAEAADALEDEHGLRKATPGRMRGVPARPATSYAEHRKATRRGQAAPDRELLRRAVRAAAAAVRDEHAWARLLRQRGFLLTAYPRWAADDATVTGYSIAMPTPLDQKPVWFPGGRLDPDLTLPRLRERWPNATPGTRADWLAAEHAANRPVDPEAARVSERMRQARAAYNDGPSWQSAADAANSITIDPTTPPTPATRRAAADLFGVLSWKFERATFGPLSRCTDTLARAATPPRHTPMRPDATTSALYTLARAIARLPRPRGRNEHASAVALLQAAAELIVALYELHLANQAARDNARGAAHTALYELTGATQHHARRTRTTQGRRAAEYDAKHPVDLAAESRTGQPTPTPTMKRKRPPAHLHRTQPDRHQGPTR